jgi:uncharacterized protein (DUF1800 family)
LGRTSIHVEFIKAWGRPVGVEREKSMVANTSIAPIRPAAFDDAKARHLLSRAGFGGTPQQITTLQKMGLDKAVDYLVDYQAIDITELPKPEYDAEILHPRTDEEKRIIASAATGDQAARDKIRADFLRRQALDRGQMNRLEQWWLARFVATPRPLEEKLVLLWHGHFASNHRTVHDSFLMLKQNALFRKHANGNFADMALAIIRDPAMLKFLNNDSNRKGHPNENLARELMELFTLGVGNYSEGDIKEGARALTGYGVEDNDFQFRPFVHDGGTKEILGQRGTFDGEGFVRVLLARADCPLFVCYKLYKHFVGDIDEKPTAAQEAVIRQLARVLVDNRYELKPVLKAMFKCEHFYDAAVVGNQIKSPAQFVAGTTRVLSTPPRDLNALSDAMAMMGQKLFDPPSVAGWYGGRNWINTSTLFVRQNLAAYLITGKLPFDDGWSAEEMDYDPTFLIEGLPERTPEAVVARLMVTLIGASAPPERSEQLITFLKGRGREIKRDTLIALLLLITAMPEFQLC